MSEPTPDEVREQVQRAMFDMTRSASSPSAQTTEQVEARRSAAKCPARHRNAVAVEDLNGETVAALCPDCGEQLPVNWAPKPAPDLNGALYETLRDQP